MRRLALPLLFALSCTTMGSPTTGFDPERLREIDRTIEGAVAQQKIPGGVFHLERNGAVYEKAYGRRAVVPTSEAMTADTIFDAASITKVVATTPSIWVLIQRGKVELDAPVSRYIPEFHGGWRDDITIRHLLTHTSALRPDIDLSKPWSGPQTAMAMVIAEEPTNRPGVMFRYSDINFELLGEIVQRVSGMRLDAFANKEIFQPLGMKDTRFRPIEVPESDGATASDPIWRASADDVSRIAPTESTGGHMLRGEVHDPTARRMGGVAGHAGLFTTVADLSRYARALLAGGGPVLRPEIVNKMITVQSPPGVAVRRAGGFDLDSSFSRPRGSMFPLGSYGHTGFTGGALWIDPLSKTFFVFLSNRVHPDGKGNVLALQQALGTLSAEAVSGGFDFAHATSSLPMRTGGPVGLTSGTGETNNGIDVLAAKRYAPLRGMRIGLITNHTGIDRAGNPTMDLLRSAPGVTLVALFSPEHGIRGAMDAKVSDSVDAISGLPVYSLYGENRKPKPEQLANLDALVFDIQDIGARYYTYISTLGMAMEGAAAAKVKFIVLDRVNPIGGTAFEGPLLQGEGDFVAWHPIPIRHGMTVGELARMYRDERHIDVDLEVVGLQRWKRDQWQDEAGLPWINTSPNMRSLTEAALYPGIGILERAVSVGRGTATPFEVIGAPWIDANVLAAELTAMALPGIRFEPAHFTPTASIFEGKACHGLRFTLTDRKAFRPVMTGVAIASILQKRYPADFALDKCESLLRDPRTLQAIRAGKPLTEIVSIWTADEAAFGTRREKYLLYPMP